MRCVTDESWHDLCRFATWIIRVCHMSRDTSTQICDMTNSRVSQQICDMTTLQLSQTDESWREHAKVCVTWRNQVCDIRVITGELATEHATVRLTCLIEVFARWVVTWLMRICDMTPSHVSHDSFTWLDMTRLYVWHASFACATWPMHICDIVRVNREISKEWTSETQHTSRTSLHLRQRLVGSNIRHSTF